MVGDDDDHDHNSDDDGQRSEYREIVAIVVFL